MLAEGKVGAGSYTDGSGLQPLRVDNTGATVVTDAHGRYHEAVRRGGVFSLTLNATTTGIAAGNQVAAAAAAATNFALWNPVGSGKVFSLLKFGMGVISGTPPGGGLFHGFYKGVPTLAAPGTGTVPQNNYLGGGVGPIANYMASAAGAALTGGTAPLLLRVADFATTNTAQASVGVLKAIELIDGDILIGPGFGWVPLWSGGGTAPLISYSVTWEELPLQV